ncbi:MAG: hypothetical protein JWM62_2086 [Frankiales bacterium]|jgi:hypothetical protein|nr:hypothetical protein [Frankiales bacterium]
MVLRTANGCRTGEDVDDLREWLRTLDGAPEVHEVVVLHCAQHGEEAPTWQYVEADPLAGVARRRCLACATTVPLLESEAHWTHPMMWACGGCGQSIAELCAGLHVPDGEHVEWVALAARCVDCGRLEGLTDVVLERRPLPEVLAHL